MSIEINSYSLFGNRRANRIRLYERKPEHPACVTGEPEQAHAGLCGTPPIRMQPLSVSCMPVSARFLLAESFAADGGNKNGDGGKLASDGGNIAGAPGKRFPLQKNKKANRLFTANRTSPERTFCNIRYYRPVKPARKGYRLPEQMPCPSYLMLIISTM